MSAGAPIIQSGSVTPGHAVVWVTDGVAGDAGPAATGNQSEIGVVKSTGIAVGIATAASPLPYVLLGLGFDSSNNAAQIVVNSFGAAPQYGLEFVINNVTYGFPGPGNGNVMGPGSAVANNLVSFNGTSGTLIKDSGVASGNVVTASGGATISAAMVPVVEASTTASALSQLGGAANPSAVTIVGAEGFSATGYDPNGSQYRLVGGNYGVILRNDGSNFLILLTDSGDQEGVWNSFRPFEIAAATGALAIDVTGAGTSFGGAVAVSGVITAANATAGTEVVNLAQFPATLGAAASFGIPTGGRFMGGSGSTGGGGLATVTFPGGSFSTVAIVTASIAGGAPDGYSVGVNSSNLSGAQIVGTVNGIGTSGIGFNWIAVGY